MDKSCVENYVISGVDRVSPLRKACPVSPKTPEYRDRSLEKDYGLFLFHQRLSYKFSGKTEWTYPLGIAAFNWKDKTNYTNGNRIPPGAPSSAIPLSKLDVYLIKSLYF